MIDSFWTKWRIRQLARGERLLVDKWLEDYARWLYGRLWYRCSGGHDRAQQLLEKIVVSAAGHLKEYTAPGPMSEWLLAIYEQLTADLPTVDKPPRPDSELRKAVGSLSSQILSGAEPFWPQLTQLSQQAMAMLSCNEQRLLMCRYFHLERPANTAIQYDQSPSQIQTLLYKASHSFRRVLEALSQAAVGEVSQAGQSDSAILEVNLEKIIRTLVLETPTPEEMLQLKDRVIAILAQNKPKSWNGFHSKIPYLVGGASILCAAVFILIWLANSDSSVHKETNTANDNKMQARQDVLSASVPDAAQQVQMAVRMGIAQDVDGLLNILRTGSYPAQVAAAYYLGRYGDKSAINLLDQVSQKWHAESSVEKNPFAEAITAIEDRMRQQMQNQLKMAQVSSKQSVPAGPDVASKVQTKPLAVESKQTPVEPNHTETPLVVHIEPNQPPVIEEVNPYPPESEPNHASPADDANEILPVDNADLYFYKRPNL